MTEPPSVREVRQIRREFQTRMTEYVDQEQRATKGRDSRLAQAQDVLATSRTEADARLSAELGAYLATVQRAKKAGESQMETISRGYSDATNRVSIVLHSLPQLDGADAAAADPAPDLQQNLEQVNQSMQSAFTALDLILKRSQTWRWLRQVVTFLVVMGAMLSIGLFAIGATPLGIVATLVTVSTFLTAIYVYRRWKASIVPVYLALQRQYAATQRWTDLWAQQAEQHRQEQTQQAEGEHATAVAQAEQIHATTMGQVKAAYVDAMRAIDQERTEAMNAFRTRIERVLADTGFESAAWNHPMWQRWEPPVQAGDVARIGELTAAAGGQQLCFPGLLDLPGSRNLLVKASGSVKGSATDAIQSLILRLLATTPAAKLKLTMFDPVGLGQNVAPFMHLADHDESLVTSMAWVEQQHIEQRLMDLTEHMANVIQKYLRNDFATIEDYNEQAGEIEEPYRLLVVMGFPVNFSDTAAKRLVSIAANGPRCGVYTIVLADTEQSPPHGFNMADLEAVSTVVSWKQNRFVWEDQDFESCSLQMDGAPGADNFQRILEEVGKKARTANRVEVPFRRMAADPERSWPHATTRDGIEVPIGRAGATKEQLFQLGEGSSQHVLVAGKTGMGKSTLLHVLITNLALTYSPNELELYLVDFKQGVEFKTYATHHLPHARVVAIESEREFGLSVLQSLDAELKRRGDLFRSVGTDAIRDYRIARPDARCPRILLLVDEFQEFFTQDDAVARQATLLLDRLVRQGRAFGIHILLGSQTLAGAYTLARTTIDQMAVRIALQCSETDARLILSEDNPLARLLSRPGEAIYNAANGLVEGNNRFQSAWLTDEDQDAYLQSIETMAQKPEFRPATTQVVFEGNAPAEAAKNAQLGAALETPGWTEPPRAVPLWLGEPIAIKAATAVTVTNDSAANLLIVGQDGEAALGMMTAGLVSLAAQYPPRQADGSTPGVCIYVLDFTPADAPYVGMWKRVADSLDRPVWVAGREHLAQIVGELKAEVDRRVADDTAPRPPTYLFIYGLQRARDLRMEDNFSLTPAGSIPPPPSPAKQFPDILRDGPGVGVHTLVWCDSVPNLTRTLDRQTIRQFDLRVVFQMSDQDSTALIDVPGASKLGSNRAYLYSEGDGNLEKFRPYGLPPSDWLDAVHRRLQQKEQRVVALS